MGCCASSPESDNREALVAQSDDSTPRRRRGWLSSAGKRAGTPTVEIDAAATDAGNPNVEYRLIEVTFNPLLAPATLEDIDADELIEQLGQGRFMASSPTAYVGDDATAWREKIFSLFEGYVDQLERIGDRAPRSQGDTWRHDAAQAHATFVAKSIAVEREAAAADPATAASWARAGPPPLRCELYATARAGCFLLKQDWPVVQKDEPRLDHDVELTSCVDDWAKRVLGSEAAGGSGSGGLVLKEGAVPGITTLSEREEKFSELCGGTSIKLFPR